MENKPILIEKTARKYKLWELFALAGLFVFLFAGLGLMYAALRLGIICWILSGLAFIAWGIVKGIAWYHHG